MIDVNLFAKVQINYQLSIVNYQLFCTFAQNLNFMKKAICLLTIATLLMACGQKQPSKDRQEGVFANYQNVPDDSTIYGLACDGSTDSILILLPFSGADPDTFDIIRARQEHQLFGRPHIGDELAVILNPEDKQEVLLLINIERLKGKWCYQVTPTFRNIDKMPERIQRRIMERIPDSARQKMMAPREYSIQLKRGNTAQSIGGRQQSSTDEMSPVEYPPIKRYKGWKLYNGKLILVTDSVLLPNGKKGKPDQDTADILQLHRDTLVLRFKDHEQGYYRKTEEKQN